MDINFEQKVREKAYEIWMAAGMEDGAAHDHWVAAEQVVMSDAIEPKKATKKAAAKPVAAKAAAKASTKTAAKAKASAKAPAKASAQGSSATH